ncbi:MAG: helix-turn-helix domain-containing protein [Cyanobacteria bacterium SBLK]|nr:helix-turn-helix domain-containing protein [Cyanobacteria bacterium SBLK]
MRINENNRDRDKTRRDPVIYKRFSDVDCFSEFLPYRQHQTVQLSCGPLQSELLAVRVGNLYFTRISANASLQAVGSKANLSHLVFSLIWAARGGYFCSHGQPQNLQTDLHGFDMQREVNFISPPKGMITSIFVPTKLFQICASQLQRDDLGDRFLATNHVTLLPDGMGQLKAYLQELFRVVQHKTDWLQQPHIAKLVAEDFVPLLVRSIPLQGKAKPALKPSRRAPLIARAEKEMVDCLEQPLTLKELARRLGSSSSALSYGFKDIFGMSPMRYLKVRRLNAVRRYLKAGDPERHKVEALANRFGFWNAGHFTKDYKTLFGELPSKTLRTPTKHLSITNWEIIEINTLQNEL